MTFNDSNGRKGEDLAKLFSSFFKARTLNSYKYVGTEYKRYFIIFKVNTNQYIITRFA